MAISTRSTTMSATSAWLTPFIQTVSSLRKTAITTAPPQKEMSYATGTKLLIQVHLLIQAPKV